MEGSGKRGMGLSVSFLVWVGICRGVNGRWDFYKKPRGIQVELLENGVMSREVGEEEISAKGFAHTIGKVAQDTSRIVRDRVIGQFL